VRLDTSSPCSPESRRQFFDGFMLIHFSLSMAYPISLRHVS